MEKMQHQLQKESVYYKKHDLVDASIDKAEQQKKRRQAIRPLKVYEINGHEFIHKFFSQFTFCAYCDDFLW